MNQEQLNALYMQADLCYDHFGAIIWNTATPERLTKFAELLGKSAEPVAHFHLEFPSKGEFRYHAEISELAKLEDEYGLNVKIPLYLRASLPAEQDAEDGFEYLISTLRIAVIPEYEGGFHAHWYGEDHEAEYKAYGPTPGEAVKNVMTIVTDIANNQAIANRKDGD